MNTEELRKLQSFIKENNIENDELLEKIMSIDVDKANRQKAYWLSINGKFFKEKLYAHAELVHVSSVKVLPDNSIRVIVDRYTFKTYSQNIALYSEENHYLSDVSENRYDSYTEITKKEYNETVKKFKYLVEKSKTLFLEI